jgi:hypothetical protein
MLKFTGLCRMRSYVLRGLRGVVCDGWHLFDVGNLFYGNAKKWSDMSALFVFVNIYD